MSRKEPQSLLLNATSQLLSFAEVGTKKAGQRRTALAWFFTNRGIDRQGGRIPPQVSQRKGSSYPVEEGVDPWHRTDTSKSQQNVLTLMTKELTLEVSIPALIWGTLILPSHSWAAQSHVGGN